jgi:hypothetical protein
MAMVRGSVAPERLLEWTVEDGYEPLCKFLDKEIPEKEFPKGNMPAQFARTVQVGQKVHMKRALRNLIFTISTLVAVGLAAVYQMDGWNLFQI